MTGGRRWRRTRRNQASRGRSARAPGPTLSSTCSNQCSPICTFCQPVPFPQSPLVLLGTAVGVLLAPLLTCSPARRPAATPWWTAPLAPTGLHSLAGPSAGDNRTTAAGRVGLPGPALLWDAPPPPQKQELSPGRPEEAGRGRGKASSSKGLGTPGWEPRQESTARWPLTISIQTLVVSASSRSFWGCITEG